jgi:hypothetical protein
MEFKMNKKPQRINPVVKSPERERETPFQTAVSRLKVSALIFLVYLILNLFHMGCPIKFFTGISCPGCGMTRAVLSALRLDFRSAFYYHPLFLLSPIMFLLFIFEGYLKPRHLKAAWASIIILFIIAYLVRLIFTHNDVVTIDIQSGVVLKLIHQIYVGGYK